MPRQVNWRTIDDLRLQQILPDCPDENVRATAQDLVVGCLQGDLEQLGCGGVPWMLVGDDVAALGHLVLRISQSGNDQPHILC